MISRLDDLLGSIDPEEALTFDPVIMTLITGDIVMTELGKIDDDNYCMMAPFLLVNLEDDDNMARMTAIRYMPGVSDIFFHIRASQVLSTGSMDMQMFKFYQTAADTLMADLKDKLEGEVEELESTATSMSTNANVINFKPKR